MAAGLSKIPDNLIPTKGSDPYTVWRAIPFLCNLYNALRDVQVVNDSGRNALTITDSNATLETTALPQTQFVGTNGGEVSYFLVNATEGRSSPYPNQSLANPS